ncbi:MAG: sigma-70 family RNA polymerase sigma factor [Oscillospiraceae bacterium]|nr:sigma-70 family RNA polymerase sigma factor [Oscillospiraceae bacterium]
MVHNSDESVLVLRYLNFVWKKARSYSNNYADIQDLSQEGLLALLKAVRTYNPQSGVPFSAYAEVCVANKLKSEASKLQKRQSVRFDLSDLSNFNDNADISTEVSPESIYMEREFSDNFYRKISSLLSKLEWEVFRLYLDDLPYSQIARKLSVSEKSVGNAVYRVRKKIKRLIPVIDRQP